MTRYPPLLVVVAALLISPGLVSAIMSGSIVRTVMFGAIIVFLLAVAVWSAIRRRSLL